VIFGKIMPKCVVITGGSSGIGRALAIRYAGEGVTLGLIGRDKPRLDEVASMCRSKGAIVSVGMLDVRERDQLATWLVAFNDKNPIELLIANAGVMGGAHDEQILEANEGSRIIFETNIMGVLNTVQPILPRMMARRAGQIALVSSLAGFIPLPDAPSYAASKAAVLSYGLALRTALLGTGIKLSVICPGYVTTPMTAQEKGWRPFEMPAERAALLIEEGLVRNKAIIAFPRFLAFATRIGGLLPEPIRNFTGQWFRFRVEDTA
jgi:short-subunit dehydrogenase